MAREVKVGCGTWSSTPEKGLAPGGVVSCVGVAERSARKKGVWDFLGGPVVKSPLCDAGDVGSIPG